MPNNKKSIPKKIGMLFLFNCKVCLTTHAKHNPQIELNSKETLNRKIFAI